MDILDDPSNIRLFYNVVNNYKKIDRTVHDLVPDITDPIDLGYNII